MMGYVINIKGPAKYKKYIKKAVLAALEYEGAEPGCEVNLEVTGNRKIHKLNKEYRGKDCPTDVLSFYMGETNPENGAFLLGDIIISEEKAAEQGEEIGHGTERELMFLSVHATLHLLGYDHETSEEEDNMMQEKQREIVRIYE